jgi:phage shock protein A
MAELTSEVLRLRRDCEALRQRIRAVEQEAEMAAAEHAYEVAGRRLALARAHRALEQHGVERWRID